MSKRSQNESATHARKERYLERLREASADALLISCKYQIRNYRSFTIALRTKEKEVWKRFNVSKVEEAWFANQLLKIFTKKLDYEFTRRLCIYLPYVLLKAGFPVPPQRFNYYDAWQETDLLCPTCAWEGRIDRKNSQSSGNLFYFDCPRCTKMLAMVLCPTGIKGKK